MTNRLPEKLTLLRKHFGYAQADIAAKLNVSVAEYMSWENGSMLCRIDQLRKLAALYSVPVADFIDNTREVRLPRADEIYDSVQIPFQNLNRPASENTLEEDIADNILPIASVQPQPSVQSYTDYIDPVNDDLMVEPQADDISHTLEFDATGLQEVQSEPEPVKQDVYEEEYEEEEDESSGLHLDRKLFILAAAILVLLFVVLSSLRSCSGTDGDTDDAVTVRISDVNRLALGRTFSAFVNDDGTLTSMGNLNTGSYSNLAQISAANSWMAGLQKDGKVVLIGSSSYNEAKKWTGIVNIAAADTHIAGVKEDGTVICTGSSEACAVDEWEDIQSVYAGNGFTIGKKRRGGLVVSGNVSSASELESLSDISGVSVGDNQVVITDSSGRVTCYPTGSTSAPNTSAWSGIKNAVSGTGFAAGLTSDGKIVTATSDDSFSKEAASLSNVLYIAARGGTLVAVDVNGNIIGAGDNTNKVYGDAAVNTADTDDSEKLAKVTNVKFEIKADNVSIKWDAVQGASYYMVRVNTSPETSLRSVRNSASIPAKSFEDGKTYRVTITASGSSDKKDSDPAVMEYQYSAVVTKLDAPKNLKAEAKKDTWEISWDSVDKAKKYIVTVDSDPEIKLEVSGTKAVVPVKDLKDGESYTIQVVASDGNEKNNSDPLKGRFEYHSAVKPLDTPANIKAESAGGTLKITWDAVDHAGSYTVSVGSDNQALLVSTNSAEYKGNLTDGTEYEIVVTARPADGDEDYKESKPASIKFTYTESEYSVIIKYNGVWSGSRAIQLPRGTYTLQQLFDKAGDKLSGGQYLANPEGTASVPMAGDNIIIEIVTDEYVCTRDGNVWQDGACKTPQQIAEEEAARKAEEERQKNISDCQNGGGTWDDGAGCVYPTPEPVSGESEGSSEGTGG